MTYLKGVVARDEEGNLLPVKRATKGCLVVENKGSKNVIPTYEKTFVHKVAVCMSVLTWISFPLSVWGKKKHFTVKRRGRRLAV